MVPLSFFLLHAPPILGFPTPACAERKNINRIVRFLSINCCLTVPAKHCNVIPFFLFIVFSSSLPHIQWASTASWDGPAWFFALPQTESQLCSPELKWIQSWGLWLSIPVMLASRRVGGHDWEPNESQLLGPHIEVLSGSHTTEWRFALRLRKAPLILVTFIKFIYLALERSKATLQWCSVSIPHCWTESIILQSSNPTSGLLLPYAPVLSWQKVMANRSKKRYTLGKALGLSELLDLFWFYTHTDTPLLL